jgi:O-antigen/teichoic acid export membrane protein
VGHCRKFNFRGNASAIWAIVTSLISPIANLVAMIVCLKFVSPEDLGAFQTVFLIVPYFAFIPLGVFNGLRRNIAVYSGKGDVNKVSRQVSTSMFVAHVTAIIGVFIGFLISFYYWYIDANPLMFACSIGLGLNLLLFAYNTHYFALFAGSKAFFELGAANMVTNIMSVVGSVLPFFFGAIGLVIRNIASGSAALLIRVFMKKRETQKLAKFYWAEHRDLVSSGFPIMLSGYLSNVFMVADRSVVTAMLDKASIGCYALTGYLVLAIISVPKSLALVIYPKAAGAYGKSGEPSSLRKYLIASLVLNFLAMAPIVIFAYLFLDDIVVQFFPDYINGLGAAKMACFTSLFMFYSSCSIVFMVLKKNRYYQAVLMLGMVSIYLFGYIAVKLGYGLVEISMIRMLTTIAIAGCCLINAWHLTKRNENCDE